ncbi:MAG: glycosyltransferase family 4 protein [Candidatus Helarchaeota archaeon]|nr:glycosyltransferase family 4 protein [Candidatus Helarchaeota archaeon]
MKIGYVVQQFYPTAYGSGIHAFELTKELVKFGHEIHIITKGEPTQERYEIFRGLHIHRMLNFVPTPYYFPLNSAMLWQYGKRIIRKLSLDILLGHGFETSLYFKLKETIPFIYKAAGTIELQKNRKFVIWRDIFGKLYFPLLGRLEKIAVTHADFVIAISDTIKHELISAYQVPDKKIYRIYNGVDVQRFHPSQNYTKLKRDLGLNSNKIILFVGRMSPIKGPQILMQAIPTVIKKFPESIFLFLGDGPLSSHLQYISRKLHVTRYVKFMGFISNSEIPKYFAMADLCVIPSLYEPFGLVALESLASGTPILSSIQGGLAEIHKFLKGFSTITPLTPNSVAKQLDSLLSNPKKLEDLGRVGRKIVTQHFTWKHCASQTNKIIEKIELRRKKN